ncbi:MAG: nucleotidyltransferase domain-containing protein [Anaerolineae bacterium]
MEQSLLQRAVGALVAALGANLVALALFGSQARGEAGESSDVDLLLLAHMLPRNPFERRRFVREPLFESGIPSISVLARTVDEFMADITPLHLDLAADAVLLYDPEDFLASRLERIRQLIQEAGLDRQRTAHGWVWWWRQQPQPGWSLTWEGFRP